MEVVRSLVLFSVCSPTGPISIEQVPNDPEAVAAVYLLVFLICEGDCASVQAQ